MNPMSSHVLYPLTNNAFTMYKQWKLPENICKASQRPELQVTQKTVECH